MRPAVPSKSEALVGARVDKVRRLSAENSEMSRLEMSQTSKWNAWGAWDAYTWPASPEETKKVRAQEQEEDL